MLLVGFCNFHARSALSVGNILVRVGPSIDHVDRALSVIDCEDRYYNFICFAVLTLAVAGGQGETKNITITHGIALRCTAK